MPIFLLIYSAIAALAWSFFVLDVYGQNEASPGSLAGVTLAAALWPLSLGGLLVVYLTRDERGD